jgi:hypothetical protein
MNPYTYKISFRVRHSSASLKDIYEKLIAVDGVIPGRVMSIGEQRASQNGEALEGTYKDSFCTVSFSNEWQISDSRELGSALDNCMTKLGTVLPEIIRSGSNAEFFVGLSIDSNSGLTLSSDLMRQLADQNIELSFDLYPPDKS